MIKLMLKFRLLSILISMTVDIAIAILLLLINLSKYRRYLIFKELFKFLKGVFIKFMFLAEFKS